MRRRIGVVDNETGHIFSSYTIILGFIESAKKSYCHYKSYRLAGVSLVIFYEETKTFLQIKQQELILSLMVTNYEDNLANSV